MSEWVEWVSEWVITNFARIIWPGKPAVRINLLARTVFRSFDITRLSISNKKLKNNHKRRIICPNFFPLFLNDFDIVRKKEKYVACIRLYTFWSTLRNYVLEAIQTSTECNFGAFYYMFIANEGLCKEREFDSFKHQKLKKNHTLDWKR